MAIATQKYSCKASCKSPPFFKVKPFKTCQKSWKLGGAQVSLKQGSSHESQHEMAMRSLKKNSSWTYEVQRGFKL